jgi:hypothetical protein
VICTHGPDAPVVEYSNLTESTEPDFDQAMA